MSKFLLVAALLASSPAIALEGGVGVLIVEESDDRLQPGVTASIGTLRYEANLYSYARSYGPVLQRTLMLSFANKFPVPIFRQLFGSLGFAALSERTSLVFSPADSAFNVDDEQLNFGVYLGLKWEKRLASNWRWRLAWDSAVFPAGATGGLLLATGRKQFLTFSTGYQW